MLMARRAANGLTLYRHRGAYPNYLGSALQADVEAVFGEIIAAVQAADVELVVFLFPSKESTYKNDYRRLFSANYLKNEEEGYADLCRVAAEHGARCVDLTPVFRARAAEKLYFDRDPHWNAAGHSLAANAMLPFLGATKTGG